MRTPDIQLTVGSQVCEEHNEQRNESHQASQQHLGKGRAWSWLCEDQRLPGADMWLRYPSTVSTISTYLSSDLILDMWFFRVQAWKLTEALADGLCQPARKEVLGGLAPCSCGSAGVEMWEVGRSGHARAWGWIKAEITNAVLASMATEIETGVGLRL